MNAHGHGAMTDARDGPVVVGGMPPPVTGMTSVNAFVVEALRQRGAHPAVINIIGGGFRRQWRYRLGRIGRVLGGVLRLSTLTAGTRRTVYVAVSGGFGQFYELVFAAVARARGFPLVMHHHNFTYLLRPIWLTRVLFAVAGSDAHHVVQSDGMAERMRSLYGVRRTIAVSNAALIRDDGEGARPRRGIRTIGYISNISVAKGIIDFLDLMQAAQREGMPVRGLLAGPFEDEATERAVRERLRGLAHVDYLGPLYGGQKAKFFGDIDLLVFPTRYPNETEGIVNLEAMRAGVPVIAYGRGCIPEFVDDACGMVVPTEDAGFAERALARIREWSADERRHEEVSCGAMRRFEQVRARSQVRWDALMDLLLPSAATDRPQLTEHPRPGENPRRDGSPRAKGHDTQSGEEQC